MLGIDKSRGYCPEMICADFLAGTNLDSGNSGVFLYSVLRLFKFLLGEEKSVSGSCDRESIVNCF
jgi:hypothetical protein